MTRDRLIEAFAALTGLAGAALLASKGDFAAWGWVAFLASNAGWITFAALGRHWWLLVQQLGFTATSLYGLWRWMFAA